MRTVLNIIFYTYIMKLYVVWHIILLRCQLNYCVWSITIKNICIILNWNSNYYFCAINTQTQIGTRSRYATCRRPRTPHHFILRKIEIKLFFYLWSGSRLRFVTHCHNIIIIIYFFYDNTQHTRRVVDCRVRKLSVETV